MLFYYDAKSVMRGIIYNFVFFFILLLVTGSLTSVPVTASNTMLPIDIESSQNKNETMNNYLIKQSKSDKILRRGDNIRSRTSADEERGPQKAAFSPWYYGGYGGGYHHKGRGYGYYRGGGYHGGGYGGGYGGYHGGGGYGGHRYGGGGHGGGGYGGGYGGGHRKPSPKPTPTPTPNPTPHHRDRTPYHNDRHNDHHRKRSSYRYHHNRKPYHQ